VYDFDSQLAANTAQDITKPDSGELRRNGRYGLVTWDIPIVLIKALDALFGLPD